MKTALALVILAGLVACTALPDASLSSSTGQNLLQQGAPALQVGFVDAGKSSVLLQATQRDGMATWLGVDGVGLTTRDGFLIATRGLGGDLMGSDIDATRALVLAGRTGQVERFNSYLDGENRVDLQAYVCDIVIQSDGKVTLPDGPVPATIFREDCINPQRSFFNLYWRDRSGRILQTRQWAGSFAGAITTRIVP